MIAFLVIYCIVLAFILVLLFLSRKYGNPYKLYMYFGKKGSGKTMLGTKFMLKRFKRGIHIYTNILLDPPAEYKDLYHLIDPKLIGKYVFPRKSTLVIDEVGMLWDNRHFKTFSDEVRDYFKLQRQYGNEVILFSQAFDVDAKIRLLVDKMYMVECKMNLFVFARRIDRKLTVVQPEGESEGRIADALELTPLWMQIFGARAIQFCFVPKWAGKYDTCYAAKGSRKPFYPVNLERKI